MASIEHPELCDKPVSRNDPHWYLTIYREGCVLCWGGEETVRVRMPGKPPKDPAKRYRHDQTTWACSGHFL